MYSHFMRGYTHNKDIYKWFTEKLLLFCFYELKQEQDREKKSDGRGNSVAGNKNSG